MNGQKNDVQEKLKYLGLKYDRIDINCLEYAEYNRLHGTNYSYGPWVAAKKETCWRILCRRFTIHQSTKNKRKISNRALTLMSGLKYYI